MQIQVHSDNHIEGSARLADWVSASVAGKLDRYDDELTRVVVHLNDENGDKAGAHDKRCQIEARPKGHQAVSVTHKAESLQLAVDGAADKMQHALESLMGKLDTRVQSSGELNDPLLDEPPQSVKDAMLEEEFLEKQSELDK